MNCSSLNEMLHQLPESNGTCPSLSELVARDIDNAADALEILQLQPDNDEAAIEAVAGWMRLKRMDPDLRQAQDKDGVFEIIDKYMTGHGSALCNRLRHCLTPLDWLEETRQFMNAHLALELTFEESEAVFLHLFRDFDDCSLVLTAMSQFDITWDKPGEDVLKCREFILENPDVFLPIGQYVRLWSFAFRSDLDEWDPDLGLTIFPFCVTIEQMLILETDDQDASIFSEADIEEMEAMVSPDVMRFLDSARENVEEVIKKLGKKLEKALFLPPRILVGTGSEAVTGSRTTSVTWRYPDGAIAVRLNLAPHDGQTDDNIRFVIFDPNAEWLFIGGLLFGVVKFDDNIRGFLCSRRIFFRMIEDNVDAVAALAILTATNEIRTAVIEDE